MCIIAIQLTYLEIAQSGGVEKATGEMNTRGSHSDGVHVQRGGEHTLWSAIVTRQQRQQLDGCHQRARYFGASL